MAGAEAISGDYLLMMSDHIFSAPILTGRAESIHTVKKKDGVAPFPRREESPYDTFGVGHSSTSISAALGIAVAANRKGEKNRQTVAIIGDGGQDGGREWQTPPGNPGGAEG